MVLFKKVILGSIMRKTSCGHMSELHICKVLVAWYVVNAWRRSILLLLVIGASIIHIYIRILLAAKHLIITCRYSLFRFTLFMVVDT